MRHEVARWWQGVPTRHRPAIATSTEIVHTSQTRRRRVGERALSISMTTVSVRLMCTTTITLMFTAMVVRVIVPLLIVAQVASLVRSMVPTVAPLLASAHALRPLGGPFIGSRPSPFVRHLHTARASMSKWGLDRTGRTWQTAATAAAAAAAAPAATAVAARPRIGRAHV